MEFRRYLKERLSQLRENEALNVTETTSEGRGIRKVEFNPQSARSLVQVPYHKKIVVNLKKDLRGLNNFLKLEGYDKNKIEKVYQSLRGSKVSSPRRDRELPSNPQLVMRPGALYLYGYISQALAFQNFPASLAISAFIFTKVNGKFYKVYSIIDGDWKNPITANADTTSFSKTGTTMLLNKPFGKITSYTFQGKMNVDVDLSVNLGSGLYRLFASRITVYSDAKVDSNKYKGFWFCNQLRVSPALNQVVIGEEMNSDVIKLCGQRGIN